MAKTETEILAEISGNYPVGTTFIPLHMDGKSYGKDSRYTVKEDWRLRHSGDTVRLVWFARPDGSAAHPGYVQVKSKSGRDVDYADRIVNPPSQTTSTPKLQVGDIVKFPILDNKFLEYIVGSDHLQYNTYRARENDVIFKHLEIADKTIFASSVYGYFAGDGDFPTYHEDDLVAATLMVNKLTKMCEEKIIAHTAEPNELHYSELSLGDLVTFTLAGRKLAYTVHDSYLSGVGYLDNDAIFKLLKLDKVDIASHNYGYKPGIGDWPTFKKGDFKAATRLVNRLKEICAQTSYSEDTITDISDIPTSGAISIDVNKTDALEILHILSEDRIQNEQPSDPSKAYRYLAWNSSHYWYCHETSKKVYKLKLSKNKQSNEKQHTSSESAKPRAVILQSSNLQIGQGCISRGVGLKGSVSKIRLGNHSSNYQERLGRS